MAEQSINHAACVPIAFIGTVLGPLFTHDPKLDAEALAPSLDAIYQLDPDEAAQDWPFVKAPVAQESLSEMQQGLEPGYTDAALYKEYRRLFIGPAHKAAPPWGSVYTDKDRVMFGETCMSLRDWLRHNGIAIAKPKGDMPEDHIGTMLQIMAWIAQNKDPEVLQDFLCNHLLTWAPHFLEEMEQETRHPFYHGLALLTLESLQGMQRLLGLEVEVPRFYQ